MKKENHLKLIASDLDGTLLSDRKKGISERAIYLIKQLKKRGVFFVAASGRQYANMQMLFAPIKDDIAYVCENGCLCCYKNKAIYEKKLNKSLALKIAKDVLAKGDYELEISTADCKYIIPKKQSFVDYFENLAKVNFKQISDVKMIKEPILKVAFYGKDGIQDFQYWQNKYGQKCALHMGCSTWLDFTHIQSNKGYALKQLLKFLKIDAKDCVAFGDYYNDKPMLDYVGCSIAMKSAVPPLVANSRYLTESVEDTLEEILNREFI